MEYPTAIKLLLQFYTKFTKGNWILRLYISTPTLSSNLVILTQYIVKLYAPVWFQIKTHSSWKDGSRHLWRLIESSRFLSSALKAVIYPVIQRNAYFSHQENLLLSMLTDEKNHTREFAARRILKARNSPATENHAVFKSLNLILKPNLTLS